MRERFDHDGGTAKVKRPMCTGILESSYNAQGAVLCDDSVSSSEVSYTAHKSRWVHVNTEYKETRFVIGLSILITKITFVESFSNPVATPFIICLKPHSIRFEGNLNWIKNLMDAVIIIRS